MRAEADQLSDEQDIIWLEDASGLRYVREYANDSCSFRGRRPRFTLPGRLVGYATLKPDARSCNGYFSRRVFWLKDYDHPSPGPYEFGGCPYEAVDPASVIAGRPAVLPDDPPAEGETSPAPGPLDDLPDVLLGRALDALRLIRGDQPFPTQFHHTAGHTLAHLQVRGLVRCHWDGTYWLATAIVRRAEA